MKEEVESEEKERGKMSNVRRMSAINTLRGVW